jgi:hypothetical protein
MPVPRSARALLVAVALCACGLSKPEVARVGERDVSGADLRHAVALQRALGELQGLSCGTPIEGESQGSACDRATLGSEILWLTVAGYAESNDMTAADADANELVSQLEAQVQPEALRGALEAHELTRDDLLELGRRIVTIRAVRTAVVEDRIGTAELQRQYRERAAEFATLEANHILLETEADAEDVYRRVRNATEAEFVALARQESTEPGAAESGGRLGSRAASELVPEFATAAVALEPGQVSRPVRTQFGWHVIYLVGKEIRPFEDVKAELLQPLADQAFLGWLEDRVAALGVEVNPRFGRFSVTTFSVEPVRSTDPEGDAASPSP